MHAIDQRHRAAAGQQCVGRIECHIAREIEPCDRGFNGATSFVGRRVVDNDREAGAADGRHRQRRDAQVATDLDTALSRVVPFVGFSRRAVGISLRNHVIRAGHRR